MSVISHTLINGLLLLARLYPNSKVETTDYGVVFTILAKDNKEISDEDIQLLESWGWRLNEELDTWDW